MICRKCGKTIPDTSIRCVYCGIKVNMVCPNCRSINAFGEKICQKCGFELIKVCKRCGTSNLHSADLCRKCGLPFEKIKIEEPKVKEIEIISDVQNVQLEENTVENVQLNNSTPKTKKIVEEEHLIVEEREIVSEKVEENSNNAFEMPTLEVEATSGLNTFSAGELTDYSNPNRFSLPKKQEPKNEDSMPVVGENEEEKFFNIDDLYEEVKKEDKVPPQQTQIVEQDDVEDFLNDVEVEKIEEFIDSEVQESIESEQNDEESAQEEVYDGIQKEIVVKTTRVIKNSIKKHVIALTGSEGSGKTAVIRQVENKLRDNGFIFLYGSCTPLIQITSFGFFQDAFLRIMGFPPYTKSYETFVRDFKKSHLNNIFKFLDERELHAFLNIFYPSKKDKFENIQINKQEMFSILEKVIKSFSVNNNLVITVDNFELLDGASYDFIVHMLEKGYFTNRVKLLVAYQEDKHIQSFFDTTKINEKAFETIFLKKLSNDEMLQSLSYSLKLDVKNVIPESYLNELIQKSDGNALRLEQEVALLFDSNYISVKNDEIFLNDENKPEFPPTAFDELLKLRLNFLSPAAKNMLFIAAIMGFRFATGILEIVSPVSGDKAENLIEYLKQELFFVPVDNYTCEFKSLTLWKIIYQEAKNDLLYKENASKLYEVLKPLILSSDLQKLISCTEALSKSEAFYIWQNTASLSSKLGDTNLFIIAQKQCLKLLEEQEMPNSEEIKARIYEQIGKLLYEKSPTEAITYLSNVLDAEIKVSNILKIIDIASYFVKSCYTVGNYFGVVEAVDAIISNMELTETKTSAVNIALIKTRKLKALLNIGNSEQIINLVNEEIIIEIEKELDSKKYDSKMYALLVDGWLQAKIIQAKAYAMQGNNEIFSSLDSIREFLEKHNFYKEYYKLQINLIEAFGQTITGNVNQSNEILKRIAIEYKNKSIETELLSDWNLINIINRVFLNQISDLKADLFELATFSNNINEHFTKNITKLILGYVLKVEGNLAKAREIIDEQTTYFAKEKVSIGFLLSWLMLVQLTIEEGDDEKALSTATKSLEIATSPKINNYIFTIYFQKFLSEIYLRKGDLTAAKMYIEKSVMIAKQFRLKYQLIELYISYGAYMKEFMRLSKNYSPSHVNLTLELYNKAVLSAKELKIESLIETAVKERIEFKTFCKLNKLDV